MFGLAAAQPAAQAFGIPAGAASGGMAPFGQQASSFAQPATASFAFGQPPTNMAFSFQMQSHAQQPLFAGFGAAAAPSPSQPMNAFGATPFGHPAAKTAPAANIFGSPSSSGTNAFSFPGAPGAGLAMSSAAAQPFGFGQAAPSAAPLFGAAAIGGASVNQNIAVTKDAIECLDVTIAVSIAPHALLLLANGPCAQYACIAVADQRPMRTICLF